MKQYNPKDYKIVFGLPPVVSSDEVIAIDTEFAGQERKRLHRPHGTFASLQCVLASDDKTVYIITDEKDIQPCLDNLELGTWVFHNFLYDVRQLRRFAKIMPRKNLWDTMFMEEIMYKGYYADFGLNHLVRRYCDIYLDKSERATFSESDGELTIEQAQYGALDVIATLDVYRAQLKAVDKDDMNVWKVIELPYIWSLMTFGGIGFDAQKWVSLNDEPKVRVKKLKEKYPGINLNSTPQVKDHLRSLGIKVSSTDAKTLSKIDNEFAQDVIKYRQYDKQISTYGKVFAEKHQEEDGRLWTSFNPIRAITSRTSSSSPALQNIPKGEARRSCFITLDPDDKVIVVLDWSSQEPRFAAHLSQDELLIRIFREGRDIYIATALHAYGEEITKDTKEGKARRNELKAVVLGEFYGKTPYGLSQDLDISKEEAQKMFDLFDDAFHGYAGWADKMRRNRKREYVLTAMRRKIWTTPYASNWDQIRVNYPIQGSASDAMKIGAYKTVIEWNKRNGLKGIGDWQSPLRLVVHDEIVSEVDKEDEVDFIEMQSRVLVEVAESIHKGIPAAVEVYSGNSWAAK